MSTHLQVEARSSRPSIDFYRIRIIALLNLLVLVVLFYGNARAATITSSPVADAYVQNGANAGKNFGSDTSLKIQTATLSSNNYDSYLKFDTSSAPNIVTAKLRIYAALSGRGSVDSTVFSVSDTTWDEATITWNNKPALGASLGIVTVNATTYAWYEIDVTSYVQGEYNAGRKVVSFAYHDSATSLQNIIASSKEGANSPQLLITYDVPPTVSITSPVNNTIFIAPASIALTVNAVDSDGTVSKVDFYNGNTLIGAVTSTPYNFTWNNVVAGTYSLSAKATDNSGAVTASSPISVVVNAPPTVSLTAPANNSSYTAPATITLTASASDSDGTISRVDFYNGTTLLGSAATTPYSYTWNNVPAGGYTLVAIATDDKGAATTSAVVSVTVLASTVTSGPINYVYDEVGRLVGAYDSSGKSTQYSYDSVGNLTNIVTSTSSAVGIIAFTPNSGAIGTPVVITGTGFSAVAAENSVAFNGVAANVTGATNNQLNVVVPNGATTGPIQVSTSTGSATSAQSFIVSQGGGALSITSIVPGLQIVGGNIAVNGTGFEVDPKLDSVSIGGASASVGSATPQALQLAIPNLGAGKVTVKTPTGTVTSTGDLFTVPAPYQVTDVEMYQRAANTGTTSFSFSSSGKVGLLIFDSAVGGNVVLTAVSGSISSTAVTIYSPGGSIVGSATLNPGGSPLSVTNLPVSGTYTILLAPSTSGTLDLSFDIPDLLPVSLNVPSGVSGYSFPISWTVKNVGTGTVPASISWIDTVNLSDTTVNIQAASVTKGGPLAPGDSYTSSFTVNLPTSTPPGSYQLKLMVDVATYVSAYYNASHVVESNENNNTLVVPISIGIPDLLQTSFSAPTSASTQQTINVSWTAKNQGTGGIGQTWWDRLYLSPSPICCTGAIQITELTNNPPLAAGGTYTQGASFIVPNVVAGTYYLIPVINVDNHVYESDYSNNQVATPITVQ